MRIHRIIIIFLTFSLLIGCSKTNLFENNARQCSNCGQILSSDALLCSYCGSSLNNSKESEESSIVEDQLEEKNEETSVIEDQLVEPDIAVFTKYIEAFKKQDIEAIIQLKPSKLQEISEEITEEYNEIYKEIGNRTIECNLKCIRTVRYGNADKEKIDEDDLWLYDEIQETGVTPYQIEAFYYKMELSDSTVTYICLFIAQDENENGDWYITLWESILPEFYEQVQGIFKSYV